MGDLIQLPETEDLWACAECECASFWLWRDGTVQCSDCEAIMERLEASERR